MHVFFYLEVNYDFLDIMLTSLLIALQKDMLMRIRREAAREDFENRNSGRFRRIFPPDDKFLREKYAGMLQDAFSVFLSGRTTSLQKEVHRTYRGQLKVGFLFLFVS